MILHDERFFCVMDFVKFHFNKVSTNKAKKLNKVNSLDKGHHDV